MNTLPVLVVPCIASKDMLPHALFRMKKLLFDGNVGSLPTKKPTRLLLATFRIRKLLEELWKMKPPPPDVTPLRSAVLSMKMLRDDLPTKNPSWLSLAVLKSTTLLFDEPSMSKAAPNVGKPSLAPT